MSQLDYFRYNTDFIDDLLEKIKKVKYVIDSLTQTIENLQRTLKNQNTHRNS